MAKKENIEGYKVIVFCPVRDASDYWETREDHARDCRAHRERDQRRDQAPSIRLT